MENPSTHRHVHRVIEEVLAQIESNRDNHRCGLSPSAQIVRALDEADLLKNKAFEELDETKPASFEGGDKVLFLRLPPRNGLNKGGRKALKKALGKILLVAGVEPNGDLELIVGEQEWIYVPQSCIVPCPQIE